MLKKSTSTSPRRAVSAEQWPPFSDITLADPITALNPVFGCVILGSMRLEQVRESHLPTTIHLTVQEDLSFALTRFWEIKEVPSTTPLTRAEGDCYQYFNNTHYRNAEGRFVVRLLFLAQTHGESKLTFEEFSTVPTVIESCLNSRPISPISTCEEDVEEDVVALAPGHFLIGSALMTPAESFDETNEEVTVCSRWKMIFMRNHFLKRWHKGYLSQLQQRVE